VIVPSTTGVLKLFHTAVPSNLDLVNRFFLEQEGETEWLERHAFAHKVLTHGFHPVQSKGMQHSTRALHDAEYGDCEHEPEEEGDDDHDNTSAWAASAEGVAESHGPEHNGQLLMGEGQGPETEVRGRMGDAVETEFDSIWASLSACG
jgi:hypothetical protein